VVQNATMSAAVSVAHEADPTLGLNTDFAGDRGRLFGLALVTGIFTVLTLGFYRFWMKTRLRRFYWSAIRPGGVPLEYLGQPLEKLLGFLIAVVFLAFYIGIVNLVLMFASFALFHGNATAYALSFIGLLPLVFYARYRARRYLLARTRWRGIRFGLEPGAWGYAARGLFYLVLTIASAGLLWPLMTFRMEKYRADRTYYGSLSLHQHGSWTMLYRPFLHVALPMIASLAILAVTWARLGVPFDGANPLAFLEAVFDDEGAGGEALRFLPLLIITLPWTLFGLLHYRVHGFRLMAAHKSAGDLRFRALPRTGRMLWIYGSGYTLTYFLLSFGIGVLLVAGLVILMPIMLGTGLGDMSVDALGELPLWLGTAVSIVFYFAIFILWGVFEHVFVTLPRLRHYAETLTLVGGAGLPGVGQRARDEFSEAEGFAEALDLGAAI